MLKTASLQQNEQAQRSVFRSECFSDCGSLNRLYHLAGLRVYYLSSKAGNCTNN